MKSTGLLIYVLLPGYSPRLQVLSARDLFQFLPCKYTNTPVEMHPLALSIVST